jgi:hypothetical protein
MAGILTIVVNVVFAQRIKKAVGFQVGCRESTLDPSNSMRSNERRTSRNDRRLLAEVDRAKDDRALAEVLSVGGDAGYRCPPGPWSILRKSS